MKMMKTARNEKECDDRLHSIINKLNHKAQNSITWTEFLQFLSNEGTRRETVNDAQLYGFGVKRLEERDRIKLGNYQSAGSYSNSGGGNSFVGGSQQAEKKENALEYFID